MKKTDVQIFFDLYLRTMDEVYLSNRYVVLEKRGFKLNEAELKNIIHQRVEGVDSMAHEMNRVLLSKLLKMKEQAEK